MSYPNTRQFGYEKEEQAYNYLRKQGLKLITRNYQCKTGEIDLIMRDKDTYVFIEVRYRNSENFGGSIESVTLSKQRKIIRTALYYLQRNKLQDKVPCRFDVIAINNDKQDLKIQWIKDAFWI